MKVIIIGSNRAEIIDVKISDLDKHFIQSRGQLYKVWPDALTRMRIVKDGEEFESDEAIIYKENAICPYHPRGVPHDKDRILAEIDEHKLVGDGIGGIFGRFSFIIKSARSTWKSAAPLIPVAGALIILAWAMMGA